MTSGGTTVATNMAKTVASGYAQADGGMADVAAGGLGATGRGKQR